MAFVCVLIRTQAKILKTWYTRSVVDRTITLQDLLDHVYFVHPSTDISVDISTDSRPMMYRSAYRSSVGRYVGRHIGRYSADMSTEIRRSTYRPTYIGRVMVDISTVSRQISLSMYLPTLGRYVDH